MCAALLIKTRPGASEWLGLDKAVFGLLCPLTPDPPFSLSFRCLWREPFQVPETYKSLHKSVGAEILMSPLTGEPSTVGFLSKKKKKKSCLVFDSAAAG